MPRLDMIVASSWVGLHALVLMGQAVLAWSKYRHAARAARHAARLAAAVKSTRPVLTVVKGASTSEGRTSTPSPLSADSAHAPGSN